MQPLSETPSAGWQRVGESSRWRIPIAVVAGAVYPLGFAPFHFWPATLASLAVLFVLILSAQNRRRGFTTGWWFGVGQYAVGVSWVYVSIRVHGSASVPLAVGLVALFVAGMALFPGLALAMVGGRFTLYQRAGLFVAAWLMIEWLLNWFLTGFPWLSAGYASFGLPIVHYAPLGGVMLVSAVVLASAVALVLCLVDRSPARWIALTALVVLWFGGWGLGGIAWTEPVGDTRRVALVQGNIPQELKWSPTFARENRERYERLSAPVWNLDLVVWPEAAVTSWWPESEAYLDELDNRGRATFVTGVPVVEFGDDVVIYNGAVIKGGGARQSYKKRQLVPFGDYVPLEDWLRGVIAFFDLPMSNARPGPEQQDLLRAADGLSIAMAICYEVAYGELVRRDAAAADVLATISNDTWFGASIGPHQHMAIARMRAIETGRYMLRGTNNGITAIVDPAGSIVAKLPQFEEGVLVGDFYVTEGVTPYVGFGNLWLFLVIAALLCGVFFLGRFH